MRLNHSSPVLLKINRDIRELALQFLYKELNIVYRQDVGTPLGKTGFMLVKDTTGRSFLLREAVDKVIVDPKNDNFYFTNSTAFHAPEMGYGQPGYNQDMLRTGSMALLKQQLLKNMDIMKDLRCVTIDFYDKSRADIISILQTYQNLELVLVNMSGVALGDEWFDFVHGRTIENYTEGQLNDKVTEIKDALAKGQEGINPQVELVFRRNYPKRYCKRLSERIAHRNGS